MKLRVKLYDLVMAFAHALDQLHPELAGHHWRVGFLLDGLADRLHLHQDKRRKVFLAGVLHDVGALPLRTAVDDLIFERNCFLHARAGWLLLKDCQPLQRVAECVLYHHSHWEALGEKTAEMREGCLINLADRVDMLLRMKKDFKESLNNTLTELESARSGIFPPHHREAMLDILHDRDTVAYLSETHLELPEHIGARYADDFLAPQQIIQFSTLFGHVIDSCSPFTATHSTGVACTARALGARSGMEEDDLDTLFVAGMLHDIGKIHVPVRLLEKPGPLTDSEFSVVKEHVMYSRLWLDRVPGFKTVSLWGALHHERLDGSGYPQRLRAPEIPLQARMMAVADIFTALTEDRPYREGMSTGKALSILWDMTRKGFLDGDLVGLVRSNADEIAGVRRMAQNEARRKFEELHENSMVNEPGAA